MYARDLDSSKRLIQNIFFNENYARKRDAVICSRVGRRDYEWPPVIFWDDVTAAKIIEPHRPGDLRNS